MIPIKERKKRAKFNQCELAHFSKQNLTSNWKFKEKFERNQRIIN